jgi:hypothetical protein
MPKNSGKDKGSLTQNADKQEARISQVSNVSKAVSAMGKETTRRMQETDRKVAEGVDDKQTASAMNGVLYSLKKTVDSLERGVETATLGTAKAAQDAIKQYGNAISEDFKINRQNMVASALSSTTPIFGYFASKFMETGVFKSTTEKMKERMSNLFKRKSKGGDLPDDFGEGGGAQKLSPAQAATKAKEMQKQKKVDNLKNMQLANKDRYENYDKQTENKTLEALTAIQSAVGAQIGKYEQWYSKFLVQHPYFRRTMTAMRAISATMGVAWKAIYFFWRPRGGYRRHLSKAKNPFQAMNQNLGALFVQTMPRLDAIMIYTKATAIAVRDMSSHITGKKYPMMDPSKLGGTWSLASGTMKFVRAVGTGLMKGARWAAGKQITKRGGLPKHVIDETLNTLGLMGTGVDYALTGPGRLKDYIAQNAPIISKGYKEKKRLMGGLEGTGGGMDPMMMMMAMSGQKKISPITDPRFLLPAPEKQSAWKKLRSKIRMPKFFKGMGKRIKPDVIIQGVYDQYKIYRDKQREKREQKSLSHQKAAEKYLKKHDKREERRTAFGFLGGIFKGIGGLLSGALGLLGPVMGMFTGGIKKFIGGMFLKGGVIRAGIAGLFGASGPILSALTSKAFLGPLGAAIGGAAIGTWINNNIIKPYIMDPYFANQEGAQKSGIKTSDEIRKKLSKEAKSGDYASRVGLKVAAGLKAQKTLLGGSLAPDAVKAGQLKVIQKNKGIYSKYSFDELAKARTRWEHSLGHFWNFRMMSQGEDPEAFGVEKEEAFLKYLQKVGTPMKEAEYSEVAAKYKESWANAPTDQKPSMITMDQINELVTTYGGKAKDYINKSYPEALEHGKKLKDKAMKAISTAATITADKAKELAAKYGGKADDYLGLTMDQATKYGKVVKEKIDAVAKAASEHAQRNYAELHDRAASAKGKALTTWAEAKSLAKRYGGDAGDYIGKTWGEARDWGELQKKKLTDPKGYAHQMKYYADKKRLEMMTRVEKIMHQTPDYLEVGKDKFIPLYQAAKSKTKDFIENVAPEKKAMIRRQLESALASGEITVGELKKMGIKLKDATIEGAQKVGNAVAQTAVYTTNQVTNAVNNVNGGMGGGGDAQKFIQEKTMDDIARGDILN